MMEFGGFGDDFFEVEESNKKYHVVPDLNWTAHQSEPGWFHEVCEKTSNATVELSVKQLHANHLYYTGRYLEAAHVFAELIERMPQGNHQREVSEGLARSYMKVGDFKQALEAACKLEKSCKSEAHFASFHSLSAEIYRIGSDTEKELFHLQQTIKSHPINVDLWLRIAECYGRKSGIDIYSNVFQLTKTKSASWFAAASLVRVEIILKSVAGKDEVGLLKKKRNQKLKNLVKPVIESLPPNFVSIAHEALSRDVYNLEPPTQDDSEFVDLGSSKLTQTLEGQDKDSSHSLESGNQQDSFEKVWFNFADSIQDINLYYIPSKNTHECDA